MYFACSCNGSFLVFTDHDAGEPQGAANQVGANAACAGARRPGGADGGRSVRLGRGDDRGREPRD